MKPKSYTASALVVFVLLTAGCAKTIHHYTPEENLPTMIYIEDEVKRLQTEVDISYEEYMYAEITTKKGKRETGRIIRITKEDLVFSPGFYYSTVDDTLVKMESRIAMPKEEIFILKIW
jgi:hypothetical protein